MEQPTFDEDGFIGFRVAGSLNPERNINHKPCKTPNPKHPPPQSGILNGHLKILIYMYIPLKPSQYMYIICIYNISYI